MTDRTVRTRYAPSPTGEPHVGNIRTALFEWALARATGGTFVLRIEDTDRARIVPGSLEAIHESLRWLGIDWDEGPDVGGPYGPYVQSERLHLYREAASDLIERGRAYPCFCSSERLAEMRAVQAAAKQPTGYDGLCRGISREAAAERAANEPHAVRFSMSRVGVTVLNDLVRGTVSFENRLQEDFVILKSDGYPTYHLAVVVDDHAMGITHAVRGDEWISSAPKHLQLYEALGWEPAEFAHLPLILGPDHKKLSKRTGDTALLDYREQGYLPEAVVNFLALLGWSLDDHTTVIPRKQFASEFSLERVVANPAVFDIEKLRYLNGQYIRALPEADWEKMVLDSCESWLPATVERPLSEALIRAAAPLVRERVSTLRDIAPMLQFLFVEGDLEYGAEELTARTKGNVGRARDVLEAAQSALSAISEEDWDVEHVEAAIRSLDSMLGEKLRKWVSVLYVAIMGKPQGIPLFDSVALLGRQAALGRLASAISRVG
ncbi:MAG: glutamate--tRNA ligase [Dehalococcoidia bacterium]